jgi:hypothetical protein
LKALVPLLAAFSLGSARAEPNDWLVGTVLADCDYCKTDAFRAERRQLANQTGSRHDPASATGYIVTIDADGRFVWGRAALVGTGNLIRTDAHVLFDDTGVFKNRDGKIYFEPMQHGGPRDLIEIERFSVQRGGALSPLEADLKNDWAIARLQEDAIEKFDGERVFAFLWDVRITQDDVVERGYLHSAALVVSREHTLGVEQSCRGVAHGHPPRDAFGAEELFLLRCPSEYLQVGSSGSALAILSPDDTWSLGGQIVAGGNSERVRPAASESADSSSLREQLFLGNAPELARALTLLYLEELIRRGLDPRDGERN